MGETSQGYVHTLQPLLCTAQFCFVGTLLFICLQYHIPVLTDHACTKKQSRTHARTSRCRTGINVTPLSLTVLVKERHCRWGTSVRHLLFSPSFRWTEKLWKLEELKTLTGPAVVATHRWTHISSAWRGAMLPYSDTMCHYLVRAHLTETPCPSFQNMPKSILSPCYHLMSMGLILIPSVDC